MGWALANGTGPKTEGVHEFLVFSLFMSIEIHSPITVVDAPDLKIAEYIGRVASKTPEISACVANRRGITLDA